MFLAHTFEYLLSYTCHNKPLHRNPKKRKKKHKGLNLKMTYFGSVFEGWVVHIERIKFVTLPAGLLAWSSHLLVWLSTAVFPCGNRAHIEVFRTVVQISKEATLFGLIVLQRPWFFHFLEFHLFVRFRWCWFIILLCDTSPRIERFKETLVTLRFIILAILQLLNSNIWIIRLFEYWDHARLLLLFLRF